MTTHFIRRALPIIALAIPATVQAHPGHGIVDLSAGAVHPFLGADHLLAMLAVGLLGAQLGGRARWAVPAAFVAALAVGFVGPAIPGMEHGVALSVLLLGAVLAFAMRLSLPVAASFAALCGLFHGAAHGAEIPADAMGALYGVGMVISSAALHTAGLALGTTRAPLVRFAGASITAVAVGFFIF